MWLLLNLALAVQATPRFDGADRLEAQSVYGQVPDIEVQTAHGVTSLGKLGKARPLLLSLFFRRCKGSCNPFLRSLNSAVQRVGGLGKDFQVVALSFDAADTLEDIQLQAKSMGLADEPSWQFAITSADQMKRLTQALQFEYQRLGESEQFEHPSVVFAIKDGRLVRTLAGNIVDSGRLREAVWELRGQFVGFYALSDTPLFRCFQYDAASGHLKPDWGIAFLAFPPLVALLGTALLFRRRAVTTTTSGTGVRTTG